MSRTSYPYFPKEYLLLPKEEVRVFAQEKDLLLAEKQILLLFQDDELLLVQEDLLPILVQVAAAATTFVSRSEIELLAGILLSESGVVLGHVMTWHDMS